MSLDDGARIHFVVGCVVGAVCGVLTRSTVALPSSRTTAARLSRRADAADIAAHDVSFVHGPFTRDRGYAAAEHLIADGLSAICVFACNDVVAVGAIGAFRDHGVAVPGTSRSPASTTSRPSATSCRR